MDWESGSAAPHYIQNTHQPSPSKMPVTITIDGKQDIIGGGKGGGTLV